MPKKNTQRIQIWGIESPKFHEIRENDKNYRVEKVTQQLGND